MVFYARCADKLGTLALYIGGGLQDPDCRWCEARPVPNIFDRNTKASGRY